jgi:hypothetical protein
MVMYSTQATPSIGSNNGMNSTMNTDIDEQTGMSGITGATKRRMERQQAQAAQQAQQQAQAAQQAQMLQQQQQQLQRRQQPQQTRDGVGTVKLKMPARDSNRDDWLFKHLPDHHPTVKGRTTKKKGGKSKGKKGGNTKVRAPLLQNVAL